MHLTPNSSLQTQKAWRSHVVRTVAAVWTQCVINVCAGRERSRGRSLSVTQTHLCPCVRACIQSILLSVYSWMCSDWNTRFVLKYLRGKKTKITKRLEHISLFMFYLFNTTLFIIARCITFLYGLVLLLHFHHVEWEIVSSREMEIVL